VQRRVTCHIQRMEVAQRTSVEAKSQQEYQGKNYSSAGASSFLPSSALSARRNENFNFYNRSF